MHKETPQPNTQEDQIMGDREAGKDPFKPKNETEKRLVTLFADAVAPTVRRLFNEGLSSEDGGTSSSPEEQ